MNGGILVQEQDIDTKTVVADMCVTEAKPCECQLTDLDFAWRIVKHVKSNAIVVVKDGATLGVGAGKDIRAEGLVLGSDGFFPFDDTVTLAAEYGVKAIVQPGGSVRDEDSVKKSNECGITMLCTGMRHFKH